MFNTFHVDYPLVRWPLDHLFHSKNFTLQKSKRLPSMGSDHFPLLTRLSFTALKCNNQTGIKANKSKHEWAKDRSKENNVRKSDMSKPSQAD
ncbi:MULTISPECIES: hypothetical protein [unclassified Colwellia]|uniref:hypothetical protein n=1 Tax=unclassified Colwellia TaxID=196834 RepID=UPI0015F49AA0|nr:MULTISPECIES: hypothetical protein [unclassified Colwellia]MBA6232704.1 hypothetical protein [Colwellia sp. MB02u-7]MBA6236208.1 hypothetical protein [Colwellia sp. MB02u-11]MBA6256540.1 hypothetical protein [Colwellia sp. MB3u-28]MBA6261255.1 hypothetical protein [Colwellia sp. MB3u-41]MBA6298392.1 hypothetical protein [Colwellia sp. MB3u-22]